MDGPAMWTMSLKRFTWSIVTLHALNYVLSCHVYRKELTHQVCVVQIMYIFKRVYLHIGIIGPWLTPGNWAFVNIWWVFYMPGTLSHIIPAFLDHLYKDMIMMNTCFSSGSLKIWWLNPMKKKQKTTPWFLILKRAFLVKSTSYMLLLLVAEVLSMTYATMFEECTWKLVPVSSRLHPVHFFSFINPALYPFTVINHIYEYNSF